MLWACIFLMTNKVELISGNLWLLKICFSKSVSKNRGARDGQAAAVTRFLIKEAKNGHRRKRQCLQQLYVAMETGCPCVEG